MTTTYTEPASKLLKLDVPDEPWLDYSTLGITREDIPQLIRMAEDHEMRIMQPPADFPEDEDLPEWYAQIHAWRALGQLKAQEAIPVILGILHQVDDEDDDWIGEDADEVFALIGPTAIRPLAEYLADNTNGLFAPSMRQIPCMRLGKPTPKPGMNAWEILASVLENYKENDEGLNGFIVYDLVRLRATEHIDLIEKTFKSDNVDEMITGDFEDVQVELGLIEKRITKPKRVAFL